MSTLVGSEGSKGPAGAMSKAKKKRNKKKKEEE